MSWAYQPWGVESGLSLSLPTIGSGTSLSVPTLALTLSLATIASGAAIAAPTVYDGSALVLPHQASSATIYTPSLGLTLTTASIGTTVSINTPTVEFPSADPSIRTTASAHELSGTADSLSVQITTQAGETILLMVLCFNDNGSASSDIDGAMTEAGSPVSGSGVLQLFYIQNATPGTHTLTFTPETNNCYISLYAMALADVVTTGGMNVAPTERSQTSTTPSTGNIVTTERCLLIGVMANAAGGGGDSNEASGSGWTELLDDRPGTSFHNRNVQYRVSDAGTYNSDWTNASNVTWVLKVVAFEGAAGGTPTLTLPTITSTTSLFAPTLAQTLSAATIASGATLNVPSLALTLELPAIGTTVSLFAPTLSTENSLVLPVISAGTTLFLPSVAGENALALPTIASGETITAPSLEFVVLLPTITTGATLYSPTLTPGDVTLTAATIASGSAVYAASVAAGANALSLPTITTTTTLNTPQLALNVQLPVILTQHFVFSDDFEGVDPLNTWWTAFNSASLPGVSKVAGQYHSGTIDDTDENLWFDTARGRADWKLVDFPGAGEPDVEIIAYNVGVGPSSDPAANLSSASFVALCGVIVHVEDTGTISYEFLTVGRRAGAATLETKTTTAGDSNAADVGANPVGSGVTHADVRLLLRSDKTVRWYYRAVGGGSWTAVSVGYGSGVAQGGGLTFTSGAARIGLIAYAFSSVATPFTGTCDALLMAGEANLGVFPVTLGIELPLPAISSGATVFTPSLTFTITTGSIAAGATVFPAAGVVGGNALATAFLASGAALYEPTVTAGAVTLELPAVASEVNFYAPIVVGAQTLTANTVATTATVFTPELTHTIAPGTFANTSTVFAPELASNLISATLGSTVVVSSPTVTPGAVTITGASIESTADLFLPLVGSINQLLLPIVASTETLFGPELTFTITTSTVTSTAVLNTPALALFVSLPAVGAASQVFTPVVGLQGFFPANILVTDQQVSLDHTQDVVLRNSVSIAPQSTNSVTFEG